MRVAATCTCLFLIRLAFFQNSNSCTVNKKSQCGNLLNFQHSFTDMTKLNYRILLYSHHFEQLNKIQKICVLRKIMGFYTLVNAKVWTAKIPEINITSLQEHLEYYEANCLKCAACKEMFVNTKKLEQCRKYKKSLVLNKTAIVQCQLRLLKNAKRKKGTQPEEIQEKTIYELSTLKKFIRATK